MLPDQRAPSRCGVCGKTSPHEDERHSWGMPWLGDRLVQVMAERDQAVAALRETLNLCNALREYAPTLNMNAERRLRDSLALLTRGALDEDRGDG